MDSLELYKKFCGTGKIDRAEKKLENAYQLIECIYSEIFELPSGIKYSAFMGEVLRMVKGRTRRISDVDAYVAVTGLLQYIRDKESFSVTKSYKRYAEGLFRHSRFKGDGIREMEEISQSVIEINSIIEERAQKLQDVPEKDIPDQNDGQNARRMQNHQESIRKWHDEMAGISEILMQMQPSVSKLLEGFMSFSDRITESYVLQFARHQVELFDLISDNYQYHHGKSEENGNEDYINAVINYEEFMYSISDCLAVFGVEEVISEAGTPFDGKIHESDTQDFSVRTAVVKESVRSGFRYKDIVIQKEKVILQEE